MIKLKSILVIIFSSTVISVVLILTIAGSSLYLSLKEIENAKSHAEEIAKLNAAIYAKYINIFDLETKLDREGIYGEKYLLEGTVRNTGYRTIGSFVLEVDFLNTAHQATHTEVFAPLRSSPPPSKTSIAALSIFTYATEFPLAPDRSVKFKHILSCQKNKDVVSPIKFKIFATNPNEWSGKFNYRITMVKF